MIGYSTEKIEKEYHQASVVLRLVIEALQEVTGAGILIFRVVAPTRFEQGVHATGLSIDVQVLGTSEKAMLAGCVAVNQRFPVPGAAKQVCTLMADPINLPNGKRLDTPHVHVQIPFDWKADPRSFLEAYGFLESMRKLD